MEDKKEFLDHLLKEYCKKDVCLAFSGGIDSTLLLVLAAKKCRRYHTNLYAVTFDTVLHPRCDVVVAEAVARHLRVSHTVLQVNELENPQILENPVNRCYLCKKELFTKLWAFAKEKGASYVLDGTNADDLQVYRPGLAAVKELKVKSPLADADFTKAEVRSYARELEIAVAERPSTPCLATRLPYETPITLPVLKQIEEGEMWLRERGYENVRLRVHGDVVRLELDKESFETCLWERRAIVDALKKIGFTYITLDLEGFRSGSMDVVLSPRENH